MKKFPELFMIAGLLFSLVAPGWSQSKKAVVQTHNFESPDHSVAFQYSDPLLLCRPDMPSCQNSINLCMQDQDIATPIACLGYGGVAYKGYNFNGAALSLEVLKGAKDETACFDFEGDNPSDETINGVTFKFVEGGNAGAGHSVEDIAYRAFYQGRCYAADLRIATSNYDNFEPGTAKEFKAADRDKVYGKLKHALETLRLSDVGK